MKQQQYWLIVVVLLINLLYVAGQENAVPDNQISVKPFDANDFYLESCGGSLISKFAQTGCAINRCKCLDFVQECVDEVTCVDSNTGGQCDGICTLSIGSKLVLYTMIALVVLVPIFLLLVYPSLIARREEQIADEDLPKNELDSAALTEAQAMNDLSQGVFGATSLDHIDDEEGSSHATTTAIYERNDSQNSTTTGRQDINVVVASQMEQADVIENYISLEQLENAELGVAGVSSEPVVYLQTVTSTTHSALLFSILLIVAVSSILSFHRVSLNAAEYELPGGDNASCVPSSLVNESFACSTIQAPLMSYWYSTTVVPDASRFTAHVQYSVDLSSVSFSDWKVGANIIANYSVSVAVDGVTIVDYYPGVFAVNCEATALPTTLNCGKITLLSARIREYTASSVFIKEKVSVAVAYTFADSYRPVTFDSYYMYLVSETYANIQFYIYLVISVANTAVFSYYAYRMLYASELKFSQQLLERQLLMIVITISFIQNNIVTWITAFYVPFGTKYVYFRETWDGICFGSYFLFVIIAMDSYRSKLKRRSETLGSRFIAVKITLFFIFVSARSLVRELASVQATGITEICLIFCGSMLLRSIESYVNTFFSTQLYTETRLEHICFFMLRLCTFGMNAALMFSVLLKSHVMRNTTYRPENETNTYLASIISLSCSVYILAFIYLPPDVVDAQASAQGYIFRERRQFITTPRSLSVRKEESSRVSRWSTIRSAVVEDVKPDWIPHAAFCVEAAVRMYNITRTAYYTTPKCSVQSPYGNCCMEMLHRDNLTVLSSIHSVETDTHCVVLRDKHRLIVAFRGTVSRLNIKNDLDIKMTPPSAYHKNTWPRDSFMHRGFYSSYCSIREELLAYVTPFVEESSSFQIYTTGHSLGAALATYAALDIKLALHQDVIVYNFGGPRVGCQTFAKFYNTNVPRTFQVVNEGDVACRKPTRLIPFQYVFSPVYVDLGTEIVMDGRGNGDLLVNPSVIEKNLYLSLQYKPARHLLGSYKVHLDAVVARVLSSGKKIVSSVPLDIVDAIDDDNNDGDNILLSSFISNKQKGSDKKIND